MPKEYDLVDSIQRALRENFGGVILKVHGGERQRKGIADILWWYKYKSVPLSFAFEVKMDSDKYGTTKLQEYKLKLFQNEGVHATSVESVKETIDFVEDILQDIRTGKR